MSDARKLLVSETERDRYARAAKISVGGREINTPHFFTRVGNPDEFLSLQELVRDGSPRIRGCVVRLFDSKTILGPSITDLSQTRVDAITRFVDGGFREFLDKAIL